MAALGDNEIIGLLDQTINFIEDEKTENTENTENTKNSSNKQNGKKLIFVTGRSAAGKTSLGEAFNSLKDFIHFGADQFAHGNDPVLNAGKYIDPKDPLKRGKDLEA